MSTSILPSGRQEEVAVVIIDPDATIALAATGATREIMARCLFAGEDGSSPATLTISLLPGRPKSHASQPTDAARLTVSLLPGRPG
jgi:hypothetical protein